MRLPFPTALLALSWIAAPAVAGDAEGPPRGFPLDIREFAGPDLVGHPISLAVDERGRVFVAETRRYTVGVKQSRGDRELEDAELRVRTVAEYREVLREFVKKGRFRRDPDKERDDPEFVFHQGLSDEIAIYEDRDGDGAADSRSVFADGFVDWYCGPGADVFVEDGEVTYACIPDLWRLRDADGDGACSGEERERLFTGLGVVFSFLGHDLHGIVRGPDGRLYFSIGDRSFHVETREGAVLVGKMGAVFRCDPDGSNLEVFSRGLRNPQDLAFDAMGRLVTGDNNCDKGDLARVLHLVEGGDHGWRLSVQRARSGAAWMRERMWWTRERIAADLGFADPLQVLKSAIFPAWVLPPLYHPVGQGPSGMFAYPGLGLPDRYENHLFLTHCAGGGGFIQSFVLEPDGAGARVRDFHIFVEEGPITGPSDAEFGYDGRIYSTNWGSGWNPNDDASLITVAHEPSRADPRVAEVAALFRAGFADRTAEELRGLLGHADMRVRRRAQFALARRAEGGEATLLQVAADAASPRMARAHAIWGLGQRLRESGETADRAAILEALLAAADDADPWLRERAVSELGDSGDPWPEQARARVRARLLAALLDEDARVRFAAALSSSRVAEPGDEEAIAALVELARDNEDKDAWLRHAASLSLSRLAAPDQLLSHAGGDRSVRLAIVLALRRLGAVEVREFLDDEDFQVRSEAARAVYDRRIEAAVPALAECLDRPSPEFAGPESEGLVRRAIAANLRLCDRAAADRLVRFAAHPLAREEHALAALDALLAMRDPPAKEDVWFDFWEVPAPEEGVAEAAWKDAAADGRVERIRLRSDALRLRTFEIDGELLPPRPIEELVRLVADAGENEHLRLAALWQALSRDRDERAPAIDAALAQGTAAMRVVALDHLLEEDPQRALEGSLDALDRGEVPEAQAAVKRLSSMVAPRGRFVRLSLAGPERILSLAEVRVFDAGTHENVAERGLATQSSVGWGGEPHLAIDGNTDGDHSREPRVTHTQIETDPYWELDLGREIEIEAVEVWNRTDGSLQSRLDGVAIEILGEDRSPRWKTVIEHAPEISRRVSAGVGGEVGARATERLLALGKDLAADRLDPALELEVRDALENLSAPAARDALDRYRALVERDPLGSARAALSGGDPSRGEELFRYHAGAQCRRCHTLDGSGSALGPDLSGVGRRLDAGGLLRSLLEPSARIAPGFGTVALLLEDGKVLNGVDLQAPTGPIQLLVGEEIVSVDPSQVSQRTEAVSAMPPVGEVLDTRELRDLVAFLGAQRSGVDPKPRWRETPPPPAAGAPSPAPAGEAPFSAMSLASLLGAGTLALLALMAWAARPRGGGPGG